MHRNLKTVSTKQMRIAELAKQSHLREFLHRRVRDGVLQKLIHKWLNAGVMEDVNVSYPDAGSPQGGVISPMLSNVFLHYVLDVWFEEEVKPRLAGPAFLIRFADDFAIGVRLICFRSPSLPSDKAEHSSTRPETFTLLGFTHYWGKTRQGNWAVKRRTASSRFGRAVQSIAQWCRLNRHRPVSEQHFKLRQKLHGHYAYYGINGNYAALHRFHHEVRRRWFKWLNRRNRQRELSWERFNALVKRYPLPAPRIVHRFT